MGFYIDDWKHAVLNPEVAFEDLKARAYFGDAALHFIVAFFPQVVAITLPLFVDFTATSLLLFIVSFVFFAFYVTAGVWISFAIAEFLGSQSSFKQHAFAVSVLLAAYFVTLLIAIGTIMLFEYFFYNTSIILTGSQFFSLNRIFYNFLNIAFRLPYVMLALGATVFALFMRSAYYFFNKTHDFDGMHFFLYILLSSIVTVAVSIGLREVPRIMAGLP